MPMGGPPMPRDLRGDHLAYPRARRRTREPAIALTFHCQISLVLIISAGKVPGLFHSLARRWTPRLEGVPPCLLIVSRIGPLLLSRRRLPSPTSPSLAPLIQLPLSPTLWSLWRKS